MKKFIGWLLIPIWAFSLLARADYSEHPDAAEFIDSMVKTHQFSRIELTEWLYNAKKIDSIIAAMSRPAEKVKPWHEYRKHFISDQRISWGVDFWNEHNVVLQKAQQRPKMNSSLYFVGQMRNHLNCATKVISTTFFPQNRLINLTTGEIIVLRHLTAQKSLIMSKI